MAFIIAACYQFDEISKSRFMTRSLIVDNANHFRSIRINARSLNLIVRFDEPQILFAAAADGHHVLVPLGPDDTLNQEVIKLPAIDRDGQIQGLVRMGIPAHDAERFSREAGRNVTILKRLLRFPQHKLTWLIEHHAQEILPAVLLGRWNEHKKGDRELLGLLAQSDYDTYMQAAATWLTVEETPLVKIGELWRLLSPLDAWANLSRYLTAEDVERFGAVFKTAFGLGNPLAVPATEEERFLFEWSKEKHYSRWAREGIMQSMILIALYGQQLRLAVSGGAQCWVDRQVVELLENASEELWISLEHEMPLLAEASPSQFLRLVEKSLDSADQSIMVLFSETDGIIHKNSHHAGLLWALESLAWLPDYFGDAVLILSKLAQFDPGGQLANRPMNSLVEIFKPWYQQTLATFQERTQALGLIYDTLPLIGRKLLLSMLPDSTAICHPTHKMRWRIFDFNFNLAYPHEEIVQTYHVVLEMLIERYDGSDGQLSDLLSVSERLDSQDRKKVLDLAGEMAYRVKDSGNASWGAVRSVLSRHRSHPETEWAMAPELLLPYELLYQLLTPLDSINRSIWLFDDWPDFPEGNTYDEAQEQKVIESRNDAVGAILKSNGVQSVLDLSAKVKEPWSLGRALANVLDEGEQTKQLLLLVNFEVPAQVIFIQNFLSVQTPGRTLLWAKGLYHFMLEHDFSTAALGNFLTALPASRALWNFIGELPSRMQDYYWQNVSPYLFRVPIEEKLYANRQFIEYRRFFTAIAQANYILADFSSEDLVELLERAATTEAGESGYFDYHVEKLLDAMEQRTDISLEVKVRLEWLYMPVLSRYGSRRGPKNLHSALAKDPQFFVEVLTWLYRPKSENLIAERASELTAEMILNRAASARKLLNSWRQVPGVAENGVIDEVVMRDWVHKARAFAKEVDREEVADVHIGEILAAYPQNATNWPPEPISKLIEELKSERLERNFSTALINQRGSTTRGVFDGGGIERRQAAYFLDLANLHKNKHRRLAKLFNALSAKYNRDAIRMDEEAEQSRMEY